MTRARRTTVLIVATTAAVCLAAGTGMRGGARCVDGKRSYSSGQGTCSWHGGVAHWIPPAPGSAPLQITGAGLILLALGITLGRRRDTTCTHRFGASASLASEQPEQEQVRPQSNAATVVVAVRTNSSVASPNSESDQPDKDANPPSRPATNQGHRSSGTESQSNVTQRGTRQVLITALATRSAMKFRYVAKNGSQTTRTITPLQLYMTFNGTECLRGYCHLRNAERHFVIARIADVTLINS